MRLKLTRSRMNANQRARKQHERAQIRAFQAVFRSSEGTPEERLARAVALTSDQAWAQAQQREDFRDNFARLLRLWRSKRADRRGRKRHRKDLRMEITFTILGDPKAQKRHRTYTKGKGGRPLPFARQVDPSATDKADFLAQCRQHAPDAPLTGPLKVTVELAFPRPKNHFRTGKHAGELRPERPFWHVKKPDADNCLKMVKDAMNGVFYRDDSQVCFAVVRKFYTDQRPCTVVHLEELLRQENGNA